MSELSNMQAARCQCTDPWFKSNSDKACFQDIQGR